MLLTVYLIRLFAKSLQVTCERDWGFPGGSVAKNSPAKQETQETWVPTLGQEDHPG